MLNYLELIQKNRLSELLQQGNFGLEKENVRTTLDGKLALTEHPSVLGDKTVHPYITTDFAEAQTEVVTPPMSSPKAALDFMETLHDLVSLELKGEVLWPYSLPPILPEDLSLIKEAQFKNPEITEYREYLSNKYGKSKQLLSGVHYNFSFSDKFLELLYNADHINLSFREYKDRIYLKLARYYLKYSWLTIYLFGGNSVAHESYIDCCRCISEKLTDDTYVFNGASSFRNGVSGYRNLEHFNVSYNSLYDYIDSIKEAINNGYIIADKEYYSQIRLKGGNKGKVLQDLHDFGISYIEIRTLDLNPLLKVGISLESLEFIHLMFIHALIAEDFVMSEEEYLFSNHNQILAADFNRHKGINLHYNSNETRDLREWGSAFIDDMRALLTKVGIDSNKLKVLDKLQNDLKNNTASIADIIAQKVKEQGYVNFFLDKAKSYLKMSHDTAYKFIGFEDLELSTQILLKDAVKYGLKYKFLDRMDNFIELSNDRINQIVRQATKTTVDNYAAISIMGNKQVTKDLVARKGIVVAHGESYHDIASALIDYPLFMERAIVVKPNSTNFGIGITIFKEKFSKDDYHQALELAFVHDNQVLVENFIHGREFRFFVIDNAAVAVLQRDPANIVGDGMSSVRELVEIKNKSPLRGIGYKTPLEKIKLGIIEDMFLKTQGLNFDSIIPQNQKIYLRENSNISTGGDSLDFTDIVPNSYKRIAVEAAKSVGARICGVDMIIKNVNNPYPDNNYAILELNYNPALHIHTYPYKGQDRKVSEKILKLLNLI